MLLICSLEHGQSPSGQPLKEDYVPSPPPPQAISSEELHFSIFTAIFNGSPKTEFKHKRRCLNSQMTTGESFHEFEVNICIFPFSPFLCPLFLLHASLLPSMLKMEPSMSHTLSKSCTTKLYPQPPGTPSCRSTNWNKTRDQLTTIINSGRGILQGLALINSS